MDNLNALQIKHGSDAGICFIAMLNLWLSSNKQPTLTDLKAALRERTVNLHAVGNGKGEFFNPRGITVDKNGTIYVSDHDNDRI